MVLEVVWRLLGWMSTVNLFGPTFSHLGEFSDIIGAILVGPLRKIGVTLSCVAAPCLRLDRLFRLNLVDPFGLASLVDLLN